MKSLILLITSLLSLTAWSVDETNYQDIYETSVVPFYDLGVSHQMQSFDGTQLHYRHFARGFKKAILILPGRTEPSSKYAELVYDLRSLPYDFILLDPRGQGYSERLIPDEPLKGYVKKFTDYAKDLEVLFSQTLSDYQQVILIGHSMGAGIGLLYELTHPGSFSKMILSSPMIELKTNGLPEPVVYSYLQGLSWLGKDKEYIPGGSDDIGGREFEQNRVTSSRARFQMARELENNDPSLVMASATVGWTLQSLKLGRFVFKRRKGVNFPPTLLFQAEHDEFSHSKRQTKFCKEQKNCELIFMKDSKHEMFQERDMIRNQVVSRTKQLLTD